MEVIWEMLAKEEEEDKNRKALFQRAPTIIHMLKARLTSFYKQEKI